MPIPASSQSARGRGTTSQSHRQGDKNVEPRMPPTTSRGGQSALPLPRRGATGRLPRPLPSSHTRSQSTSTTLSSTKQLTTAATLRSSTITTAIPSTGISRSRSVVDRSIHRPVAAGTKPTSATAAARPAALQQHSSTHSNNLLPDGRPSSVPKPSRLGASHCAGNNEIHSYLGSRLQDELLQLSLVHARSHERLDQYAASARSKLEAQAAHLKREEGDLSALEAKRQEGVNLLGLVNWVGNDEHPYSASEQVRNLSFAIQQLGILTQPGGDFTRFVEEFDTWLNECEDAVSMEKQRPQHQQHQHQHQHQQHVEVSCSSQGSGSESDAGWEQTVEALKRRVRFCQTTFSQMRVGSLKDRQHPQQQQQEQDEKEMKNKERQEDNSAIGHVVSGHIQLADAVMDQLELCARLRSSILSRQKSRISDAIGQSISEAEEMKSNRAVTSLSYSSSFSSSLSRHSSSCRGLWQVEQGDDDDDDDASNDASKSHLNFSRVT